MGRFMAVTMLVLGFAAGAAACSDSSSQGAKEQDVEELQGRVSQLRLEVQNLRREVAALRGELEGAASGGTTSTTVPSTTTTSRP